MRHKALPKLPPEVGVISHLFTLCVPEHGPLLTETSLCLCSPADCAAPQACDFSSAIQPVKLGAVGTAWPEHEFDSVKKIYILGHLKKDRQPGG